MSVQTQIDRLNTIKERIRTNLVAQGITVPADTMLDEMAEQILSVAGEDGQRGTGLLAVTTGPSSYTTEVGGITPKYRMALSTIKSQSGVTEVLLGDTIRYSYYHYPIAYLDASYAYCTTRVSIRGTAGTTPVKGTDYWTAADQESIVQQVITALGTPVFGRVDGENVITLTGALADGTYTFQYEDEEGNTYLLGSYTKEPEPTYTNILPLAINSDGTLYNGGQGWKTDTRLSSSGNESTSNASGIEVTGFIPVVYGDSLYLKNIEMIRQGTNADKCYVTVYNSAFTRLGDWRLDFTTDYEGFVFDGNNNLVQINVIDGGGFSGPVSDAAYLRFSAMEINSTSIVTKNQPIA